jgi:hypothetical protein
MPSYRPALMVFSTNERACRFEGLLPGRVSGRDLE